MPVDPGSGSPPGTSAATPVKAMNAVTIAAAEDPRPVGVGDARRLREQPDLQGEDPVQAEREGRQRRDEAQARRGRAAARPPSRR